MQKYGSSISENISIIKEILRLISLVVDFFGVTTYSKLMRLRGVIFGTGILVVLLAVLSVLLFVDFGGESSRIAHEVSNFGHLPLFGVAALVILWMLGGRTWPVRDKRKYAVSFAAALGLGVVTEFVQLYTPERYFEIQDIVYDALGAFTFLAEEVHRPLLEGDGDAEQVGRVLGMAVNAGEDGRVVEFGERARLAADQVWIVDPVDGTREYSLPGRRDWAVHIALWQRVGGPDGTGWPFGRSVQSQEVYAALARIPGVDMSRTVDVALFPAEVDTGTRGAAVERLDLPDTGLIYSFDHQVKVVQ